MRLTRIIAAAAAAPLALLLTTPAAAAPRSPKEFELAVRDLVVGGPGRRS